MVDEGDVLEGQDLARQGDLLRKTRVALGVSPPKLAALMGVSRRSVSRWIKEGMYFSAHRAGVLARLAHPHDRALAAEIAATVGETLVSLGLEKAAPPAPTPVAAPAPSPAKLVDAVVCAAAEAMDASPRAVRPGLLAALKAARELGLTTEALEAGLRGKAEKA